MIPRMFIKTIYWSNIGGRNPTDLCCIYILYFTPLEIVVRRRI
jgi:hypothetical protein